TVGNDVCPVRLAAFSYLSFSRNEISLFSLSFQLCRENIAGDDECQRHKKTKAVQQLCPRPVHSEKVVQCVINSRIHNRRYYSLVIKQDLESVISTFL